MIKQCNDKTKLEVYGELHFLMNILSVRVTVVWNGLAMCGRRRHEYIELRKSLFL